MKSFSVICILIVSMFVFSNVSAASPLTIRASTDSTTTILSSVTDAYGMMVSHGRVEVVINESADDIAYGTPKYYAVPMAGYSKLTLKCLYGPTTTSVPIITCILSSASDITLATGNPVWFDSSPIDSTITGWMIGGEPSVNANLGKAIPVADIYGNWATSDYIIVKVDASTDTVDGIQDFKLIAIKEQ